jgi:hypothetical protein
MMAGKGERKKTDLPRSFRDGVSMSSGIILPLQAGVEYVPPDMSKKSTPASSNHLITTQDSAELVPPSMTVQVNKRPEKVSEPDDQSIKNVISLHRDREGGLRTILTVEFGGNDELVGW